MSENARVVCLIAIVMAAAGSAAGQPTEAGVSCGFPPKLLIVARSVHARPAMGLPAPLPQENAQSPARRAHRLRAARRDYAKSRFAVCPAFFGERRMTPTTCPGYGYGTTFQVWCETFP